MKIVRVQYTTTHEYAAKNMENIVNVADEVKRLNHPGIKYAAYLLPDGKTLCILTTLKMKRPTRF